MNAAAPQFVHESKLNPIPPASVSGTDNIRRQPIDEGLQRLNSTIAHLEDKLSSLEIQQNALRKHLNTYKSVIPPIHKLFPEILQAIFIQCLPPMRNAVMSSREIPLLLGRICHQWREIAYATPHLWSSIHIVVHKVPTPPQSQHPPPIEEISAWLHRSGALPLSISVHFHEAPLPFPPQINFNNEVQLYLDTLANFKSRWCSLYLSFPFCGWATALGQFNAADLPLLEEFCITGQANYSADDSGVYPPKDLDWLVRDNGILQVPSLHTLGLPLYGTEMHHLPVHWENLTSLTILSEQVFDTVAVKRVLLQCQNLTICTLRTLKLLWPLEEDPSATEINLPSLKSLSLTEDVIAGPTVQLLKYLHTPQLRYLSYEYRPSPGRLWRDYFPPSFIHIILPEFLGRLTVPLEELNLMVRNIADVDIVGILRLMPELKRLSLNHLIYPRDTISPNINHSSQSYFQDHYLLNFTAEKFRRVEGDDISENDDSPSISEGGNDEPSAPLCMNLEVFHCVGASFSDTVLLDFLRSRCDTSCLEVNGGATHLKIASIVTTLPKGQQESEDTRSRIRQLQEENPSMLLDVTFVPWVESPRPVYLRKRTSPYDGLWVFGKGW